MRRRFFGNVFDEVYIEKTNKNNTLTGSGIQRPLNRNGKLKDYCVVILEGLCGNQNLRVHLEASSLLNK